MGTLPSDDFSAQGSWSWPALVTTGDTRSDCGHLSDQSVAYIGLDHQWDDDEQEDHAPANPPNIAATFNPNGCHAAFPAVSVFCLF